MSVETIRVLDPLVVQQVAAGEVVDRPASVVKELVENSLDAQATRIEVELADGGRGRIVVRDDGSGMETDDAQRSVLAHATSKIARVEDLEVVSTMGFRGEALPSIASVSAFSLTTATGEGAGTRVVVDGGAEASVAAASHPKGTSVVVDRLFYNVPARRAFLKGARTERAVIVEMLNHLAVCHPEVAFRVTEGGRELLSLPSARDAKERLAQVYGAGKVRAFRRVAHRTGPFDISGYAAPPSITYTNRSSCQTVSVNGRWVRVENLSRAIDDAYRGTVGAGRYPPLALDIRVDPQGVDVNVHPTKQLVRFSDERGIRSAVADALKLATISWNPRQPVDVGSDLPPRAREAGLRDLGGQQESLSSSSGSSSAGARGAAPAGSRERQLFGQERFSGGSSPTTPEGARRMRPGDLPQAQSRIRDASRASAIGSDAGEKEHNGTPRSRGVSAIAGGFTQQEPFQHARPERGMLPSLAALRVVGQVASGYIVLEEPDTVWFVDQHVAHERAILDRLTDADTPPTVQPLLVPEVVELAPEEAALAAESVEELGVYGFEAEPFGRASVRITSVISTLSGKDVAGAFVQALAAIRGTEEGMMREQRILATIACHSAVKLGDRLSMPEIEALIKDWLTSRLPATCPHGRSICFRMDVKDIGRKLDRH